ncbi:IDEAL domain-containing protein [Neobacillus niacini]|uniref:IDEAL domain-containing protein n=1 Tax=Neobacillus niacini TaxID=86668 RepID=UPI002FFF1752
MISEGLSMELTGERFATGDWVIIGGGFSKGWTGYILKYDFEDDRYKVRLTSTDRGKTIDIGKWFDPEDLMLGKKLITEQEIRTLIDLALDTNDKEWFKELSSKLPLANF